MQRVRDANVALTAVSTPPVPPTRWRSRSSASCGGAHGAQSFGSQGVSRGKPASRKNAPYALALRSPHLPSAGPGL